MNTRMFKNGFQSAMILVVVAILGLAAGTLIRDLMQATTGDSGAKIVEKQRPDNSTEVKKAQDQAPADTAVETSAHAAPKIPQFDILRVEKDGGVLVAGRTQPNNNVEIMRSTGEVLGKVTAKRNGDFVVTLDEQLSRGEHILSLASTGQDGAKTVSAQTGVVFVPGASGEVLALINQDGKASRVATMPESLKSDAGQAATSQTNSGDTATAANIAPSRKVTTIEKSPLLVEAVEVEGKNVFVAGAVAPAALVRIYIDNVPVGSVRGTADHRFLLEKTFDLSEGEHVVRADVINEKTGGVWSRVVVDLKHEVPTELLNVAGEKGGGLKEGEVSSQADSTQTDNESTQLETAEVAKVETPKTDVTTVQVDKVKQSAIIETTTKVVETAKVETTQPGSTTTQAASNTSDASAKVSDTQSATSAASQKTEVTKVKTTETEVTTIKTGRSIIVKWGDSLWRISRRTYGRGIRYTTIYNANRSQISDPNKIYVGQVFKIPAKADL